MKMRKFKLFMAWEHEAEEKWLEEMESQGWHFSSYHLFYYVFEKGEPNRYQYRLEMLPELPSHPESRRYIEFMADMGVDVVDTYLRWVYFRKPYDDTPFELYSDLDARIRHLTGILRLLLAPILLVFCNMINCLCMLSERTAAALPAAAVMLLLLIMCVRGFLSIRRKLHALQEERRIRE